MAQKLGFHKKLVAHLSLYRGLAPIGKSIANTSLQGKLTCLSY
jgi:hypothetical protein